MFLEANVLTSGKHTWQWYSAFVYTSHMCGTASLFA